jgi:hypothetical protein
MSEEIDTALLFCVWLTIWHFPRGKPRPPTAEAELITTNNRGSLNYRIL